MARLAPTRDRTELLSRIEDNTRNITATIAAGDIEIGAVELKDAGTDTRANVLPANTARTTATNVLAVQHVDAAGVVLSSGTQRTPAVSVVTTSGSVAAGKQSVQLNPSNDFTGTLLGAAWPGTNQAIGFSVNAGNDTLAAVTYTVTTGSITIITIT